MRKFGFIGLLGGSLAILAIAYAQAENPRIPDHPIVPGPIPMKSTALFRDAATLWLTSNMENSGTVQAGAAKKFVRVTVFERTILVDSIHEWFVRHERYERFGQMTTVGGNPTLVRNMTSTEHLAAMIMFNRALLTRKPDQPMSDENGIRGHLVLTDVGLSSTELMQMVQQKRQEQMAYLANSGGTP